MKKIKRIYLSPPHMSGRELALVKDVFKSNWIAPLGHYVDKFEEDMKRFIGRKHVVALTSGTAAIHLILRLLKLKKGDEVFCSSFTFCGSANPIIYEGATPVFIDSDDISWNMDPSLLEDELKRSAKHNKLPKAVIVVQLYGQCADMDSIAQCCAKYNVTLIEDAAEALGALYKGKKAGTFGYASILSFNGNKIITTSGGGMLLSDDKQFIEKARFLATQARDKAPHYQHSEIGYNYRMSNVLAAIGVGQLERIEERVAKKRNIFGNYQKLLSGIPGIEFMPEPKWSKSNRWLTCILVNPVKFGAAREEIRLRLEKHNIESRPLWKPMHMQPVFRKYPIVGGKVSEKLFEQGLCLPSGTALKNSEIDFICGIIKQLKH